MKDEEIVIVDKQFGIIVGGGSECIDRNRLQRASTCVLHNSDRPRVRWSEYNDKVGSLMASDSKHISNEYVNQGKVVIGWQEE